MALYHVHVFVISKAQGAGSSAGFAQYIQREGVDHGEAHADYIAREGRATDDLVAKGEMGLPAWARSARHFFAVADERERHRGTVARCFEIALPRELSEQGRLDVAADIRAAYFEQFPSAWAIHNPIDRKGEEHPHMHVMLSERRETDGFERGPTVYFTRAAGPDDDPAAHGARKERSWHGPVRLREFRAGVSDLLNAALEREGHAVAVSSYSLTMQGHARDAVIYTSTSDRATIETQRQALHSVDHPRENAWNLETWQAQKRHAGIRDISRAAMVDHVRDQFWRHDRSPAREQERAQSLDRAIEREYARTGLPDAPRPEREAPARPPLRTREMAWGWGHGGDDLAQAGRGCGWSTGWRWSDDQGHIPVSEASDRAAHLVG